MRQPVNYQVRRMENLFYTPPDLVHDARIKLEGQEARHALRVMRYREGEPIAITDGLGTLYSCVVRQASGDTLSAEIVSRQTHKRPSPYLAVAVGNIKKRDRLEFAVEKLTELGADDIVIYNGDHSEKSRVRMDRIEKTIASAMKQSQRLYLPSCTMFPSLETVVSDKTADGFVVVAADEQQKGEEQRLTDHHKYLLVVGPEGGFSEKERSVLNQYQAVPYSLGDYRLRTETAAIIMTDHFRSRHRI